MATPQELYDETKTRLDLNIAKLQMLQKEIQEKQAEAQKLMQPIMEDQGAIKQLEKLNEIETIQTVESK
jgi:predicted RNase H-like nuclease (RuvC/YqgF family)|tara:strand:+ start:1576 stop:1782 length:207 start_codon:yes stop_codon:yes gene_type:complete